MKAKLTKRTVEAIAPGAANQLIWDTEIKGFGCKITPKGKRVYFLYYRTSDNYERRPAIGAHGAITCEQARLKLDLVDAHIEIKDTIHALALKCQS